MKAKSFQESRWRLRNFEDKFDFHRVKFREHALADVESNFLAGSALCQGVEATLRDYADYRIAAGGSSVGAENDWEPAWWELDCAGDHGFAGKFTLAAL